MITNLKSTWKIILLSTLFEMTRMGAGATSVIYLLSRGISLSDLATIKILQGITIIFFEIPTGIFADFFGRSLSILCAVASSIISILLYLNGDSFIYFAMADIMNAIAISFWSGAFEAYVVDSYQIQEKANNFLEILFSYMSTFEAGGTMLAGFIGGLLADINLIYPFVFSLILGIITFIFGMLTLKETKINLVTNFRLKNSLIIHLKAVKNGGVGNPSLIPFFVIQILIQFMFQPVLHYWQPYFKSFDVAISDSSLGLIFFLYVGFQMLGSWIVAQIVSKFPKSLAITIWFEMILMTITLIFLSSHFNIVTSVLSFIILQGAAGNFRTLLGVNFNKYIASEQRATILSSVSLVSRFGMLGSLTFLNLFLAKNGVHFVFLISLVSMLALIPVYLWWNQSARKISEQI